MIYYDCLLAKYRELRADVMYCRDVLVNRRMRLSHETARKYALIMNMRLLVATDPDHGKLTKLLCVCTSVVRCHHICKGVYGPLLHVGGEIL